MLIQILYREEDREDIDIIMNRVQDLIGDIVQFERYLYTGVMVKTDGAKQREIHTIDQYQWDKGLAAFLQVTRPLSRSQ